MINGKSPLDPVQKDQHLAVEKAKLKVQEESKITNNKTNKNRVAFEYLPGMLVLKKNIMSDKLADPWSGPYEIISVPDSNRVVIQEETRESKQNI